MENEQLNYTKENYEEDCRIAHHIYNLHFYNYENFKEDLIQVALIGLSRARKRFDDKKATYSTYACKVCFNEMNDFIYKEYYQSNYQSLNEKNDKDNIEELINCIEDKSFSFDDIDDKIVIYNAVNKYFKKLKENKNITKIKMYFIKGFDVKEICEIMNMSRMYICRVKEQFKQELKAIFDKELRR